MSGGGEDRIRAKLASMLVEAQLAREAAEAAVRETEREVHAMRALLGEVVRAWGKEAASGDGIDEDHADLYARAKRTAQGGSS